MILRGAPLFGSAPPRLSDQKIYFKAIWILRGGSVDVIRPKFAGAFMLAAGPPQLTRLKALNSSVRNWSVWLSKSLKFFWMLKSSEIEP